MLPFIHFCPSVRPIIYTSCACIRSFLKTCNLTLRIHWVHAYNQYHSLVWGYIQLVHGHAIIIANTLTLETTRVNWIGLHSISCPAFLMGCTFKLPCFVL